MMEDLVTDRWWRCVTTAINCSTIASENSYPWLMVHPIPSIGYWDIGLERDREGIRFSMGQRNIKFSSSVATWECLAHSQFPVPVSSLSIRRSELNSSKLRPSIYSTRIANSCASAACAVVCENSGPPKKFLRMINSELLTCQSLSADGGCPLPCPVRITCRCKQPVAASCSTIHRCR
ncbi:hypothetical protein BDD12DRAFT_392443 [Trichophaea hybrida]|nr:hypothetical protein BDD12DRAFT_392443 [Trichophaea hybrida]